MAVSSWRLACAVSSQGQLGVVSGTALDAVLARRLQLGDPEGHYREAFDHFPIRDIAESVWNRYFVPGGKETHTPYKAKPISSLHPPVALQHLMVLGSFVEVFLAKRGHKGVVGINLLEKIQLPTIPTLFGAMLAGVDYVLMGAGIPRAIPGILNKLSRLEAAELPIAVAGSQSGETFTSPFDPAPYIQEGLKDLKRPTFLAIISSSSLAITLAKRCDPPVDGFVIEGDTAGGHNAPPRGGMTLDEKGEPIYGPRDVPDLAAIRELGLPFWLAGSYGVVGGLASALKEGAAGIQVGTAFAFCEESGILPEIKQKVLTKSLAHELQVRTDPLASPTGFPFKVVDLVPEVPRERICDLGYLRQAYKQEDGSVGFRCSAEPIDDFVRKGGVEADTTGRTCVCNGLMATIGLAQVRHDGSEEQILVTAGNQAANVAEFLAPGATSYTAKDVLNKLLAGID